MSDNGKTVGSVELNASAKLVFSIGQWKGRAFAQARKFVVTNRYQGPTPSGFSMNGAIASAIVTELRKLQTNGPPIGNDTCAVIAKNRSTKIRLGIVLNLHPVCLHYWPVEQRRIDHVGFRVIARVHERGRSHMPTPGDTAIRVVPS